MRVFCISDTHAHHAGLSVPDGDLPIHAGDLSEQGYAPIVVDLGSPRKLELPSSDSLS